MCVCKTTIISLIVIVLSIMLFTPTYAVELKDPYCGPFAVYTTLKLFNKDIEFIDLLKEEYIGSYKGSSIYELKKALEDHQMHAMAIEKYTTDHLRLSPYPVILHVKKVHDTRYNHYMVYLGTENNKAVIFDSSGVQLMPFYKLKSIWSGNGIIVSNCVIKDGVFKLAYLKKVLFGATSILLSVILIKHILKKKRKRGVEIYCAITNRVAIIQCIIISVSSAIAACSYNLLDDGGFLAHNDATAIIEQLHRINFVPKITKSEMCKVVNDDDIVILDARLRFDYENGHIEGAVNVPVNANDVDRQKVTTEIPKDSRIVIYCQSSRCKYSEVVAIKLIEDGYSNISIFRGGWAEWVAKNGKSGEIAI